MTSTNVSEFNPILSEDTQLKILSRLESMEDTQIDIHNVIDSVCGELVRIHDTIKLYTGIDIDKQRREKDELLRASSEIKLCPAIPNRFVEGINRLAEARSTPEGEEKFRNERRDHNAGIQCVIFSKKYFNDEQAREWLLKNGFIINYEPCYVNNPRITEDYFSYMQFDIQPRSSERHVFNYTTPIKGIEFIIFCKK